METGAAKKEILAQLQKQILAMQGFKTVSDKQSLKTGLGIIEQSFPGNTFPMGAIHEFISPAQGEAAATNGFIAGLLSGIMQKGGTALWIGTRRTLFPPALKAFGIEPDRIVFIDLIRERDVLWAVEQALKCDALTAVVGELKELGFTESRRLQLAVEESKVTGFIHRHEPKGKNTVACVSRWKIAPLSSDIAGNMPGVGHPRWDVNLLKVRNGTPGAWQIEWESGSFHHIQSKQPNIVSISSTRNTG